MAVEFKASMTKAELLKIAAENGVTADDSMTKTAILDALEAHNAAEAAGAGTEPPADGTGGNGPEAAADGAESAQDGAENAGAGEDTPALKTAQRARRRSRRGTTCSFTPDRPFRKADCGKTPCSTGGFRT